MWVFLKTIVEKGFFLRFSKFLVIEINNPFPESPVLPGASQRFPRASRALGGLSTVQSRNSQAKLGTKKKDRVEGSFCRKDRNVQITYSEVQDT